MASASDAHGVSMSKAEAELTEVSVSNEGEVGKVDPAVAAGDMAVAIDETTDSGRVALILLRQSSPPVGHPDVIVPSGVDAAEVEEAKAVNAVEAEFGAGVTAALAITTVGDAAAIDAATPSGAAVLKTILLQLEINELESSLLLFSFAGRREDAGHPPLLRHAFSAQHPMNGVFRFVHAYHATERLLASTHT